MGEPALHSGFSVAYKGWVEEVLEGDGDIGDAKWSETIAVGSKSFVEKVDEKLVSGQLAGESSGLKLATGNCSGTSITS